MDKETRRKEFDEIFKDVDERSKKLISPLIDEIIYLEGEMEFLRTLPKLQVNKSYPEFQKKTESAKLYKEDSQSYMNGIRILYSVLKTIDGNGIDDMIKMFEKFK